jgi:hypothetical protein
VPRAVFRTLPTHPPCARCSPHRVRPRTTFFSRHGFRSWFSSKIRTVSRPNSATTIYMYYSPCGHGTSNQDPKAESRSVTAHFSSELTR